MKFFANSNIWKKIVIVITLIMTVSFVVPKPVEAGFLGTLGEGVTTLFVGIADGVIQLVDHVFANQDNSFFVITEGINLLHIAIAAIVGVIALATGALSITGLIIIGVGVGLILGLGKTQIVLQNVWGMTSKMLADESITLPNVSLTPYEIFSNKAEIFSVNFFKKSDVNDSTVLVKLRQTISDWYKTLRLIAIVGMMAVLVYVGIRIVISSATDKAKYKEMLWDWLVAMIILFSMHFIMSFSNLFVESITGVIDSIEVKTKSESGEIVTEYQGQEGFILGADRGEKQQGGYSIVEDSDTTKLVQKAYEILVENGDEEVKNKYSSYFWSDVNGPTIATGKDDAKFLFWPTANFLNQARLQTQLVKDETGNERFIYVGHALIYILLVVDTCIFIFIYMKRFIYMVFLTLISPLVALTYPIDKIKDGQAQAFNFWFREYIYNLLLQPLHLLLYMILIGSAMGFATNNIVYVAVALGFMIPAEKLIRSMFGFKGETQGTMAGVAAGALLMSSTQKLFGRSFGKGGSSRGSSENSSNKDSDSETPARIREGDGDIYETFPLPAGGDDDDTSSDDSRRRESPPDDSRRRESPSDDSRRRESPPDDPRRRVSPPDDPGEREPPIDEDMSYEELLRSGEEEPDDSTYEELLRLGEDYPSDTERRETPTDEDISYEELIRSAGYDTPPEYEDTPLVRRAKKIKDRTMKRIKANGGLGGLALRAVKTDAKRGVRMAARTAGKVTGAAVGGAAGAIAGIASGDLSKGIQSTTVGALAGSGAFGGIGDRLGEGAVSLGESIKREWDAAAPDTVEKRNKKIAKRLSTDSDFRERMERNIGKPATDEFFRSEDNLKTYVDSGRADEETIIAAEAFRKKHREEGRGELSREKMVTLLDMNDSIAGGKISSLDPEARKKWTGGMEESYRRRRGMSKEKAKKAAKDTTDMLVSFGDIKRNLRG